MRVSQFTVLFSAFVVTVVLFTGCSESIADEATRDYSNVPVTNIEKAAAVQQISRHTPDAYENITGGFFGKEAIEKLLKQEGAVGIDLSFARNDVDQPIIVGVAVNAEGNRMINGELIEMAWPCPPLCGSQSLLSEVK